VVAILLTAAESVAQQLRRQLAKKFFLPPHQNRSQLEGPLNVSPEGSRPEASTGSRLFLVAPPSIQSKFSSTQPNRVHQL
jgi:hypothetical protein